MIFEKPPLFRDDIKILRPEKKETLCIEGKWPSIKRLVYALEDQGWQQRDEYPDVVEYKGERLTSVEMYK